MIREHLSDPLWSSSTNRMSNKSISEIKLLKEQAMKERHKKATAQAASQAFKRFDGMFNIEPRRPQDESFLSTTIKHVLGDYATFMNLIEAKETAQYYGLDNTVPGTPEVKDIDFDNTNNGYTNLMIKGKNGISSHSSVPLKKTLENIKIDKNDHTFLEPTKTSNGPENDQSLKLKIPNSNSTSNHLTNNKHSQGKTPNEIESILKEMTQGLPPLLTEIQTPRSENDFFSFPSKVNVASNCLATVDLSVSSSANDLSKDVSNEYVQYDGLNDSNNMTSELKEFKSCDEIKNKKLQDKTKSSLRKVSVSSSSSSNSESSSTSESESDLEEQATQCYISSDNFQGNSTNNNYLLEKDNASVPESSSTLNSYQNLNGINEDFGMIDNDDKINSLNKRSISILDDAALKNIEDSFHIGIEKTVSPISEISFDDLDLINSLPYDQNHDESDIKSDNLNPNVLSFLKTNNKNYNQDCMQSISNDSIYTTKNNDVRNAASNKINETKDKSKTKSTRTPEYNTRTPPEYNTDIQQTLPIPLFKQNTSLESTLYIVDQYTESSMWVPHVTPLPNSPVLSQLPDNIIKTDCTFNTNSEIYASASPHIDNMYVVTENSITNIDTNINVIKHDEHNEYEKISCLDKNIKVENLQTSCITPFKIINDSQNVTQELTCKPINDSQNVTQELTCKPINNSQNVTQELTCKPINDSQNVTQELTFKPINDFQKTQELTTEVKMEVKELDISTNLLKLHNNLADISFSKMEEQNNFYNDLDVSNEKPELKLSNDRNMNSSLVVKIPLKKIKLKAKCFQDNQKESVEGDELIRVDNPVCIKKLQSYKRKLIDDDSDSCSESAFKLPHSSKFDDLLVKINLSRLKRNPIAKTIQSEVQSDLNITPIKNEISLDIDEEASSDCSSNSINIGLKKKNGCPLIDSKMELGFKNTNNKVDVKRCSECGILNADSGKDPIKLSGYKVYRPFLNEGVMKKRKADNLKSPMERAHTYTEAVLNYIRYLIGYEVAGKLMTKQGIDELMRICSDCIRLIDYVVELCRRKTNDSNRSDRRFLFLCFRLQSMLHMKLFKTRSDSVWKVKKIMTDYFTQYKPSSRISTQSAEGNASTPLTSSPSFGPSPGQSIGSNGSAGSSSSASSNDSKTNLGLAMVSIPSDMHEKSLQYLEFTKHIIEAHRLWSNAETLIPYCEDFIIDVTRKVGPLTLYSSLAQMVDYMTFGLQVILDSPYPS
ncbi:TNF receptor-associated factor family protein DDB_G0272098 isoform X2 [Hydra vulgaris]|uniref:AF4/FMR2 family member lilli n=1 Tax=Hydra vulgaris TaxID=6087 RepID=A0ABM4D8P7_HYDVU